MKLQIVQHRKLFIFIILMMFTFLGCTAQATKGLEQDSAQAPAGTYNISETPSEEQRLQKSRLMKKFLCGLLRKVLSGNQTELERVANDLIDLEIQAQKPFSMDYVISSEELYLYLRAPDSKEAFRSGILSAVSGIDSNPQLENIFERILTSAEKQGFSSYYLVRFMLPVYIDDSECHHCFSLCYSSGEAPSFMSYTWVEKIDSHWFLMDEVME